MTRVLVGLSGGVDSALTACLLKKQGYEVIGAIMSIWDDSLPTPKEQNNACLGPEEEDIKTAKKVADFLGIPFEVVDCREIYKKIVIENFKKEYSCGHTPNPCIWCNSYVKFGALPTMAKKQGILFDKFATGHYAKIDFDKDLGRWFLEKSPQDEKDQTYFLYRLTQEQLQNILFPLGAYTKPQVRELALKYNLPVAQKQDSQDFYCGDYNDILNFSPKPGNIVDINGKVLGKHTGIWNYTIGKRKGLTQGGTKEPLYVIKIDGKNNQIIAGPKNALFNNKLFVNQINWLSIACPSEPIKALVKIRRQHKEAPATITPLDCGKRAQVVFDEPQMSITAGQSAVFYLNNRVLGGGIIE